MLTDGPKTVPAIAVAQQAAPPSAPDLPNPAGWPAKATAGEAFHHMVEATLVALCAHRPAAVAGEVEGVHQMRVTIRRLRAILHAFRPALPEEAEARFRDSLGRLARLLGEARDWDVFIAETLPTAAMDGMPIHELARLEEAARRARALAQFPLRAALGGAGFTNIALSLSAWAEDAADPGSAQGHGLLARRARRLAPRLQKRLVRKVHRRGRHIRQRSEAELHALRKAVKKLRYGVEALEPLHKGGLKPFRRACQKLQEHLGALNDSVVTAGLTQRLEAEDPTLAPQAEALRAWARHRREHALAKMPKAWRSFRKVDPPRLAR